MAKDKKNEEHVHLEQIIRGWVRSDTGDGGPLENVPAPIVEAVLDSAFAVYTELHERMGDLDISADDMIETKWNFCDRCHLPWPSDFVEHDEEKDALTCVACQGAGTSKPAVTQ